MSGAGWANRESAFGLHGFPADGNGEAPGPCHTNCVNRNEVFCFHPGGANHVYADGSVHFVKETASIQIMANLISRAGGEILSADPFGYITTSRGVDLETGRLNPVKEKEPKTGVVVREICPAAPGAKDWQPSSWSPRTGLLYIPHQNLCQDEQGTEANYIAGTPYVAAIVKMYAGPGGHRGEVTAWDPVGRKAAWKVTEKFPVWSGSLVTAGDVVFYGTMDGWLKALDARSGKELWRFKTGSGIIGQPVTYRGPDGKQYVAVLSGVGGWAGAVVHGMLTRIVPFLVWFHRCAPHVGKIPIPSTRELMPDRAVAFGFWLHLLALFVGASAIATGSPWPWRAFGALLLVTGLHLLARIALALARAPRP